MPFTYSLGKIFTFRVACLYLVKELLVVVLTGFQLRLASCRTSNQIRVAPLLQIVVAGHKVFKLLDELKRDGMTAFPPCISYLGTKEQETTTTHP